MKLKNLFVTLGLALAVGVGVGAGAAAAHAEPARSVDATETDWHIVGKIGGANKWAYADGYAMTNTEGSTWVYENLSLSSGDEFKIFDGGESWQGGWGYNNGDSSAAIKAIFTAANDGANIVCGQTGVYTITFTQSDWHIKIEEGTATTHTVTKYAIYGDVLQAEAIGSDVVADGASYAIPAAIHISGYHFNAWYLDQNKAEEMTAAITVTADVSIYAHYTAYASTGTLYFAAGTTDETDWCIYSYGGDEQFGSWPGSALSDLITAGKASEGHGVLTFDGVSQNVYAINFYADANDTHIIFNKSSASSQTANLTLIDGHLYTFSNTDTSSEAAAAAYLYMKDVEAARNAVVATETNMAYSVCGISSATAATLYNAYLQKVTTYGDSFTSIIANSATYTYNAAYFGDESEGNISFDKIVAQLRAIAVAGGETVNDVMSVNANNSTALMTYVIIAIAVSATVALAVLIVIKKRKSYN